MAQSGLSETSTRLSAFGMKRTCRELGRQIDRSQMTRSRPRMCSATCCSVAYWLLYPLTDAPDCRPRFLHLSYSYAFRFKAINSRTREGQPGRCLIGRGNGRQDARPCFARLPVAVLRNLRLGGGSSCFWLGLFRARCSRDSRRSFEAPALTWTKTISRSSAPQRAARPASGATTTLTCSPTALSLAASSTPMPGQLARRGCGRWPSGTTRIECRRMAMSRRARPPWRRSRKAGGGNKGNGQKAPYLQTPRLRRQGIMSDEIERLNDPRPAD